MILSRRSVGRIVQLCYRISNHQTEQSHVICRYGVNNSLPFQSFAVNISSFRNYSTNTSKEVKNSVNEDDFGLKPISPVIRGKAATSLQVSYIHDFIADRDDAADEDWDALLKKISKIEHGLVNSVNIDGRIMEACCTFNKLNLARSYLKYMRKIGKKFNSATVTGFIRICYDNRLICTQEDLARVEQFTKYLIARYTVIDQTVGGAIVKGLCLQNDWQKCGTILDKMKEYLTVANTTISSYIVCLIENDDLEKGWHEMELALEKKCQLTDEVYLAWLNKVKSNPEKVEELLKLFQKRDILPKKIVCDHLISIYSEFPPDAKLNGSYVSIKNNGICKNCNEKLQRVSISEEEFNTLRNEFLNRVLIDTDIFKNTTPDELQKFFKCVEKNAPFDIVIDGLNVMYMTGSFKSQNVYAKLLNETVRHFVERGQKVLVIGRKHMYSFAKDLLTYIRENSTLFLIDDSSEDDPYMIYATFYSGPDACFVSRDLMRSEKYRLSNDELAILFKRWQLCHQIFINHVSMSTGRVYLKSPIMFEISAQRSRYGWHVPYHIDTYSGEDQYGVHEHWLCLKK